MTPADLVRQRVLSKAAVYFWLDDTAKPDKVRADSVAKVCKALRISRDWLLTGRGPMDSDSEPQSQSHAARLEPAMLAESIAALRHVAARRGWAYDPETHAEATCFAYEMRAMLPENPSTADVIDFAEKVGDRLRQAVESGSGQSGTSARTGADDRGEPRQTDSRKARSAGGAR